MREGSLRFQRPGVSYFLPSTMLNQRSTGHRARVAEDTRPELPVGAAGTPNAPVTRATWAAPMPALGQPVEPGGQGVSAVRSTHPPGPRPTQAATATAGELLTQLEIHCLWHVRCPLLGAWESHLGSFFTIPITHLLACAVQVPAKSSRA